MKVTCAICNRVVHLVHGVCLHEISYKTKDFQQRQEEDVKKYGHKAVPVYSGGRYS